MLEQSAIMVAVGVDEAGREDQPVRVDDAIVRVARPMTDCVDAAVDDPNLGVARRRAGAVDDPGIDDERCLRLTERGRADDCKSGDDDDVAHEAGGVAVRLF